MIGTGNDVQMCRTSKGYNGLKDDESKNMPKHSWKKKKRKGKKRETEKKKKKEKEEREEKKIECNLESKLMPAKGGF